MEGPDAVAAVLAQLEGFEAPAGAWETEILPARIAGYEPAWLDDLCLVGTRRLDAAETAQRTSEGGRAGGRAGAHDADHLADAPARVALAVAVASHRHGASRHAGASGPRLSSASMARRSSTSWSRARGLLAPEVEDALAELVALGLVNSDSFGGLRALLVPADQRRSSAGQRRRRAAFGMEDAGRWALLRRTAQTQDQSRSLRDADATEHVARILLRRYGVVFWRLLEREAAWLPPWRELLRVYRRLEARGDIRGGRFVAGFSGEQFALPEAIGALREVRRKEGSGAWISVSGADPLNLAGSLTPGAKLAGAHRQPPALSRRHADRILRRRRGALSRKA